MQPVTFNWRKYNNQPHWVHHTHLLGEDNHGIWFLQKQNQLSQRPGMQYHSETQTLLLVAPTQNWVAKIFPKNREDNLQVYIDVAHDVQYHPATQQVTGIDMDLDIIQLNTGKTWIEDQDEFLTHSHTMNYPQPLVEETQTIAEKLYLQVLHQQEAFNLPENKWYQEHLI